MISVFVLTMLAIAFAYAMKVETKLAANSNNENEIEWLGRSGVEYARWVLAMSLMNPMQNYDSLDQPWATGSGMLGNTNNPIAQVQNTVQLPVLNGMGSFTWKITDLDRKFNINTATEALLQQAFSHIGMEAGDTAPIIGSILNWTASGNNIHHSQGANPEYYQTLDPPYDAKNGPIDDISELMLIRGVTPELYWGGVFTNHTPASFQLRANSRFGSQPDMPIFTAGLVDLFTPVSSGRINLNTCSAEVLEIIPPGIDPLVAAEIVGARSGEDDGSGLVGPYRSVVGPGGVGRVPDVTPAVQRQIQQFCDVHSRTFEVEVTATVGTSSRTFIAILGRNSPRDVQVLSFCWKSWK
jgi:general secretion pathway protein K